MRFPKRDPIKNYFPLPNEVYVLGLKPTELSIYAYLLRIEDRKTFECYASYKTIGKAVYLIMVVMRRTDVKTAPGEDSWRSCFT